MYAWKCWHDSRDRVILYAVGSLAIGLTYGATVLAQYHVWLSYDWRRILHRMPWYFDLARSAWDWGLGMAEESLFPAAVWLALSLGTMSVGREYGSATKQVRPWCSGQAATRCASNWCWRRLVSWNSSTRRWRMPSATARAASVGRPSSPRRTRSAICATSVNQRQRIRRRRRAARRRRGEAT